MSALTIAIRSETPLLDALANQLAKQTGLTVWQTEQPIPDYFLHCGNTGLSIVSNTQLFEPIKVDFAHGKLQYRKRHGGGRKQLIARAVGLHKAKSLSILDATAGLGADSYVFATLGAKVTACERNPVIAALLTDGLMRAKADGDDCANRIIIECGDGREIISQCQQSFDVVYCDPMYPETGSGSALNKKEMRIVRDIVGCDQDADDYCCFFRDQNMPRTVVKRPMASPQLPGRAPDFSLKGKSTRYDVYLAK